MTCCRQQRGLAAEMMKARRKFNQRLAKTKRESAKQFAILREPILTTSGEKQAAIDWLISDGWTVEEIYKKLGTPIEWDSASQ